MILLSIPVHENMKVVEDQIRNFKFFVPDAQIVLHISRQWLEKEPQVKSRLEGQQGVWINPTSLWTGHNDGIVIKTHIVNFEFAEQAGIEFDYFCLHASNELFIKPHLEDYIRHFDAGVNQMIVDPAVKQEWLQAKAALRDPALHAIMREYKLADIFGSQVEGTFYRRELFRDFVTQFRRYAWYEFPSLFHYAHGTRRFRPLFAILLKVFYRPRFYAKEEIYPPTIIGPNIKKKADPYCYIKWSGEITSQEIEAIRTNRFDCIELDSERHPYHFSVKRVNRDYNDPVRTYIRSLLIKE
jgi:hypothetical protein